MQNDRNSFSVEAARARRLLEALSKRAGFRVFLSVGGGLWGFSTRLAIPLSRSTVYFLFVFLFTLVARRTFVFPHLIVRASCPFFPCCYQLLARLSLPSPFFFSSLLYYSFSFPRLRSCWFIIRAHRSHARTTPHTIVVEWMFCSFRAEHIYSSSSF